MRNMVIFIVIVLLVVGFLIYLTHAGGDRTAVPPAVTPAAATVPAARTVQRQGPDGYVQLRPAPATAAPASAPASAVGASAPMSSRRSELEAAAREARVAIVLYKEGDRQAEVAIEWKGDSAGNGGDFLDLLIKKGVMRDFDYIKSAHRVNRLGQSVWTSSFTVKFFN